MSNQCVVVLTDEQIDLILRRINGDTDRGLIAQLRAALEHPEGITEEQVDRAQDAYDYTLASANPMRAALGAALFPGEDEPS